MSSQSRALQLIDDALIFVRNYSFDSQVETKLQQSNNNNNNNNTNNNIEWSGKRVRQTFIKFFEEKHNHTFVPSSSVVPHDDPTLLFTNAGMNQFKPIFLGSVTPDDDTLYGLRRACNSQKCIRAGGKHNDLDDVGRDEYHHCFFEMLGNWSFGDYFKEGAISMAWQLLTQVYGLNPNFLYATYFGGNEAFGLEPDKEAQDIWRKYLPDSRILPFGMKDNFWEMGETGPCGPCTEIHYDRLERNDAASLVNMDDPTVIEIWNNVFIQFNRDVNGKLHLLPDKHVDTGMGFERITSILQKKMSNYDTDIFSPIIDDIQRVTGCTRPYTGKIGEEDQKEGNIDMAYRVVADHIRTATFAITDGAQPDSQGRDYVIRRVLRRGIRYGSKILGGPTGFLSELVDSVVREMGDAFPEISSEDNIARVKQIIKDEEELFEKTRKNGETRFEKMAQIAIKEGKKEISGKDAFLLQSSFGYPKDLTVLMAEEKGLTVNLDEFDQEIEREKEISKQSANKGMDRYKQLNANELDYLKKNNIQATDSSPKYIWEDINAKIVSIFKIPINDDNNNSTSTDEKNDSLEFVESAQQDEYVGVILDRTSFYHESGGQVGDEGNIEDILTNGQTTSFKVDYVKINGIYDVHYGSVNFGEIRVGETYLSKVNYSNRSRVAPNHTMTHVLNYGLRKVLGNKCDQKGSIVDAEKARFDFSHNNKMTIDEIRKTQEEVQNIIKEELDVYTEVLDKDSAFGISAIRAMFGEKYPPNVRVVSVGVKPSDALKDPSNNKWFDYSIELCGGTHLSNTKDAGDFLIISEEPLSAGVRRIVAYTGEGAKKARNEANVLRNRLNNALNMEGSQLTQECTRLNGDLRNAKISALTKEELNGLLDEVNKKDKKNKKELSKKRQERAKVYAQNLIKEVSEEKSDFIVRRFDVGLDANALKAGIKVFHKKCNIPILLISGAPNEPKNKVLVKAEIPKKFKNDNNFNAKEWVDEISTLLEGGGGGNDKAAQCQGLSIEKIDEAINIATIYAQKHI